MHSQPIDSAQQCTVEKASGVALGVFGIDKYINKYPPPHLARDFLDLGAGIEPSLNVMNARLQSALSKYNCLITFIRKIERLGLVPQIHSS